MKVAHILNSVEYSGLETMLYQASGIFKEANIDTTLLACYKQKGNFEQQMLNQGYSIANIGTDGKLSFLVKFFKYFRDNKFDYVHIHTDNLYVWEVIILRLTKHRNIVRSYHNCWTFTGFLRYKRILHRRIATFLGVKNHAIGNAVQLNEQKVFLNKCFIINNWINLNSSLLNNGSTRQTKRAELGIGQDDFVIISIGGCSPVKNHGFIIGLVKALVERGIKLTYLHVGTGIDENSEKDSVRKEGLETQITFAGNRADIPELLICSDVYLMPSLYEGLSIALLEAMYYNGIVIVNNAPGLNNLIVNNETGYVIEVASKGEYIDKLLKISQGVSDTKKIKSAAGEFVEQNFSMEKNCKALIDFYKDTAR